MTVISHVGLSVDDATAEEIDEVVEGEGSSVLLEMLVRSLRCGDAHGLGLGSGISDDPAGLHLDRTWPDVVHAHDWLTAAPPPR